MLLELASKYCVDKLHSHSYIPAYEELFAGRRVGRLLEIGIGYRDLMEPFVPKYIHGASLKMWNDYFEDAIIYGCDIREDTLFQSTGIRTFQCDQSDYLSLQSLIRRTGGGFDVIIDDGSHQTEHQIFTALVLLRELTLHGVYIIEDVQEPKKVMAELAKYADIVPFLNLSIECAVFNKRIDDTLVVVKRT